jgi:prepilin-type N-terminal cleavage/methylation domain-containing protein
MTRTPINRKYVSGSFQRGETGFTLIEMIMSIVLLSILGTIILQIVSTSLSTSITMSARKERGDDAVMVLERISREVREANTINAAGSSTLTFTKKVTSSLDSNKVVRYMLDSGTIRRESATSTGGLGGSTSGNIVAENVTGFTPIAVGGKVTITLEFDGGSEWQTIIYARNYGL